MRIRCGGGERHEIAVQEGRDGLEVRVDGHAQSPRVRELAPGTFVFHDGGRSEVFHCVREGELLHLFWHGNAYRLTLEKEGARAERHAEGGLETPMPGKVIKLSVVPGQAVARGDEILVVEAMKMENAVRAPRDGRVKSIAARVGEMVSPGVVLAEIE